MKRFNSFLYNDIEDINNFIEELFKYYMSESKPKTNDGSKDNDKQSVEPNPETEDSNTNDNRLSENKPNCMSKEEESYELDNNILTLPGVLNGKTLRNFYTTIVFAEKDKVGITPYQLATGLYMYIAGKEGYEKASNVCLDLIKALK